MYFFSDNKISINSV